MLIRSTMGLLLGSCLASAAGAQGAPLPWGKSSDMAAWETFALSVAPSGNPAAHKVEFETWASDEDIYLSPTPRWPGVDAPKRLQLSALGNAGHAVRRGPRPMVIGPNDCGRPLIDTYAKIAGFPPNACMGEEVRRNWATYQYIVANGLHSKAGFARAFKNKLKIDLPSDSVEFKGDWIPIGDLMTWFGLKEQEVRSAFYISKVGEGATSTEYALISFHFAAKQTKTWVWSNFEHYLNPGRCDDVGCHDSFGAVVADVPANAAEFKPYGPCAKTPALLALFEAAGVGAVWQNYCLSGSQVTYTNMMDGKPVPTILGSAVTETVMAGVPVKQSSCITCHAYASFDQKGNPNIPAVRGNYVGNVDPKVLDGYLANDFIWGNIVLPD